MKKIIIITVAFITVLACSKSKDGDWNDIIKLSQKEVLFSSEQNRIQLLTKGDSWWINEISLDGELVNLEDIDTTRQSFIIEGTDFSVERKNAKEIHISLKENKTGIKRIVLIGLQAGNYFEVISVTQLGQ